jgi:hypothetical protein
MAGCTKIVPSRFDDALPHDTPRAESCHERVVLATQHHDVGVGLVQVVGELGEEELFRAGFLEDQVGYLRLNLCARSLHSKRCQVRGYVPFGTSLGAYIVLVLKTWLGPGPNADQVGRQILRHGSSPRCLRYPS